MIRTVIIDNNLDYSKKILNTILSNFKDIQLMYVATTYKEGINIIKNNLIDLVLIDLKLPDNGGIKIIKQLNSMNNIQKPRIVVISGNYELVSQVNEKDCIIYKLDSFEEAYKKIERIISDINYENNGKEVKRFIASEIFKLGYNIKHKGTQYIIEAIIYVYERNNMDLIDNLEQNVYRYISYKHNKTINNIKTNIIKATRGIERANQLTPKISIIMVLNKMHQQFN